MIQMQQDIYDFIRTQLIDEHLSKEDKRHSGEKFHECIDRIS